MSEVSSLPTKKYPPHALHHDGSLSPLGIMMLLISLFLIISFVILIYYMTRTDNTHFEIFEVVVSPDEPLLFYSTTPIREIRIFSSEEEKEPSLKYLTTTFYLDNISNVSSKLLTKYERSNGEVSSSIGVPTGQLLISSNNVYVGEEVFTFFSFSGNQLGIQSQTPDSKLKLRVYSINFEGIKYI